MAVIKTVKPDGTGDFTTLQAWWNWAKTQTTPDHYIAECYGGGNLGQLDMASPGFTPDASNYFEIRNADGENPYINVTDSFAIRVTSIDYTEIRGIKCVVTDKGSYLTPLMMESCEYFTIERCWFELTGSVTYNGTRNVVCRLYYTGNGDIHFNNNVVICPIVSGATYVGVMFWNSDVYGDGGTTYVYNNTVFAPNYPIRWYGGSYLSTSNYVNVISKNNVAFFTDGTVPGDGACFEEHSAGLSRSIWSITQEYCCSQDDTADDWGGVGNIINATLSDCFTDYNNEDFTPKVGGTLYDAGTTISEVTEDYLGNPRPFGKAYDIGAYESTKLLSLIDAVYKNFGHVFIKGGVGHFSKYK